MMGRVEDEIEQTMDNLEAQLGSLAYGNHFDSNNEFNP